MVVGQEIFFYVGKERYEGVFAHNNNNNNKTPYLRHGKDSVDDEKALVQQKVAAHAPSLQQRSDRRRALAATDLLVVAEAQVHRSLRWPVAHGKEVLDRLHMTQHALLVVDRPAA